MSQPGGAPALDRRTKIAFLAALGLLLLLTYAPRVAHYGEVQSDRDAFFAGEIPLAGPDSFYWFRAARERAERDRAPASGAAAEQASADEPDADDAPWLARVLALLANATGSSVYVVGPLFALVTGALFMLPMACFGARAGWAAAGLVGATLGANSAAIYARTSIFRIDTDALILLGLWVASLLAGSVRRDHTPTRQVVLAVATGLATAFVVGWHEKPVWALAYLLTFPLALFAARIALPRAALLTVVFAVAVVPTNLVASFGNLAAAIELYGPAITTRVAEVDSEPGAAVVTGAPQHLAALRDDTTQRITETQRLPLATSLSRILDPGWLAAAGLVFALVWCLVEWRRAVPLLPILGLGLLGLVASNRFLLFLAPFAGLGLGAAATLGTRFVLARRGRADLAPLASVVLAVPLAALLLPATIWGRPLGQYLSTDYLRALADARASVPDGATVWGHWGEAYPLQDVMRVETPFASLPDPERGHLYLGALTDSDPARLHRTIGYLHTHPRSDVRRAFDRDYAALREEIERDPGVITDPAFVALTRSSIRFFETHHRRGQWSAETGWPPTERIVGLSCAPRVRGKARCVRDGRPTTIDFQQGRIGRRRFSRLVFTLDGHVQSDRSLDGPVTSALVVARTSNTPGFTAFTMREPVARSLLVEMLLLGRFDAERFELTHDAYPELRLYRVRSAATVGAATAPGR